MMKQVEGVERNKPKKDCKLWLRKMKFLTPTKL